MREAGESELSEGDHPQPDGPLVRPLYRISLDGTGFQRLSSAEGTHRASFDPTFSYYLHTASSAGVPPVQALRRADGQPVRTLQDNRQLREELEALQLRVPEFLTVQANGVELNAWMIKPHDFDPARRYPLLMYVYGGPGSQTVTDAWWCDRYLWHHLLAAEGVPGGQRGQPGDGRPRGPLQEDDLPEPRVIRVRRPDRGGAPLRRATLRGRRAHRDLGVELRRLHGVALHPQGGRCVQGRDRRGAGHRLALVRHDLHRALHAHAAGKSRGLRGEGAPRLRRSAAGRLPAGARHGDDNVHAQNSTLLVERLEEANKQFDFRLYPNKADGIRGPGSRVNLFTLITDFVRENL